MYNTGITFASGSTGWVTGSYHSGDVIPVYRTDDGGQTWKPQDLTRPRDVRQATYGNGFRPIFFRMKRENGVLPIGFRSGDQYTIVFFATKDGGRTWESTGEVEAPLRGNTLIRTSDAGKTWRQVNLKLNVVSLWLGSASDFLALVRDDEGQLLVHSSDGGETWAQVQADVSPLK